MFELQAESRMGFILSTPRRDRPVAGTAVVPTDLLAQFVPKRTHIGQAVCAASFQEPAFNQILLHC